MQNQDWLSYILYVECSCEVITQEITLLYMHLLTLGTEVHKFWEGEMCNYHKVQQQTYSISLKAVVTNHSISLKLPQQRMLAYLGQ